MNMKCFLLGGICIAAITRLSNQIDISLKRKHLVLLPTQLAQLMETKTNSSGHIISSKGSIPEIISWLSLRFDFSYKYLPFVSSLVIDDLPQKRGKISFLRDKEADGIVGAILPTVSRFKDADFPMPWMHTPFGIIIPFPKVSTNLRALVEPWDTEVWIGLLASLPSITMCIYGLSRCLKKIDKKIESWDKTEHIYLDLFHVIDYVICVLLSQGTYFTAKKLSLRCAAAVWCLSCFIFVQSYSCMLISVISLPINKPIINSVYDIPRIGGLQIVVNRGMAVDAAFTGADFGIFKQFRRSLTNNPDLLCNTTEYCLDRVHTGSYVYMHGLPFVASAIREDHKKNGYCRFTRARDSFWVSPFAFALAKKSPYMESFNRGFAELWANGLIQYWTETYSPDLAECLIRSKHKPVNTRLSSSHFAGAFLLLAFGYGLSFIIFLGEMINSPLVSRILFR